MQNIKMTLAYDGRAYLGWQKTKEGASIEETLQKVLETILQEQIALQAASRTDSGVHANGQVVNFMISKQSLDFRRLAISLNNLLPPDIAIIKIELAHPHFHPTLDCTSKEYHYWVCFSSYQLPFHRQYSWHIHHSLDFDQMNHAAARLIGEHDFSAFSNAKKNECYASTVRTINEIKIGEHPEQRAQFIIRGPQFLYKMARNIVGTLIEVGKGKIPAEKIISILKGGDRTSAGVTAPAHGLTLHQVFFDQQS